VTLLLDLSYNGRFQLAVDVDMVFGRSVYLSVMVTKMLGVARLQFTRLPFTHWSFAFCEVIIKTFRASSNSCIMAAFYLSN
jgi:PDZ domain-containing protein 8